MSDMQFVLETIEPADAEKLLEKNKRNRTVSKALVKKYAKMMLEGEWYKTHQSIAIDKDGILVDGQHRLMACVESGIPLQTIVVKNAEQNPYLDMGKNRNWSDNLNIATNSQRYTKNVAQIYNLLLSISKIKRKNQLFRQTFCDFHYKKMELSATLYKPGKIRSGGCPMIVAIFLCLVKYGDVQNLEDYIRDFVYIFNTGNCSADEIYDMEVKQMRDNFLAGKREFSCLSANTSTSNIRFYKTLYFAKALQAYVIKSHYYYKIDLQEIFQKEIQTLFLKVENKIDNMKENKECLSYLEVELEKSEEQKG